MLRTPLLPLNDYIAWRDGLRAPSGLNDTDDARLATLLDQDRAVLSDRLVALFCRPEIREALFLASPDLEESLTAWLSEPRARRSSRIESSLLRYFIRMTCRPTPFGTLAGVSLGGFGKATQLTLGGRSEYRRHTRLDTGFLSALTTSLVRNPKARLGIPYCSNPTLHRFGSFFHYLEQREDTEGLAFHLVRVRATPHMVTAVSLGKQPFTLEELAAFLVKEHAEEVSIRDARRFTKALADASIVVPVLLPPVTGGDWGRELASRLGAMPRAPGIARCLRRSLAALDELDSGGLGIAPSRYRTIAEGLRKAATFDPRRLYHVDLYKPGGRLVLSESVLSELRAALGVLHRFAIPRLQPSLEQFRGRFLERYGEREIPLLEALDTERGIGLSSGSDATDLDAAKTPVTAWAKRDDFLLRKLGQVLAQGRHELTLERTDLAEEVPRFPAPAAVDVRAVIVPASHSRSVSRRSPRVVILSAAGPPGARLLGRFCHLDPTLQLLVKEHLRSEEMLSPEALLAELAYVPEGTANLVMRPVLREYEIPCFGLSGAPPDRQISLNDLLVSVRADVVMLRSARLGQRILPRLTSAQMVHSNAPSPCRFLHLLQEQGVQANLAWSWGSLAAAPFLPRVRCRDVVFARAQWNVGPDELDLFEGLSGASLYRAMARWREDRRIPSVVFLHEGDQQLLLDLENVMLLDVFMKMARRQRKATLVEIFPTLEQPNVLGPEGAFAHEVVIPLLIQAPSSQALSREPKRRRVTSVESPTPARIFPPGSEWLYLKWYAGPAALDDLLCEVGGGLVEGLAQEGVIDRWFFIRYADPEWHVRLRLHGPPARLLHEALARFKALADEWIREGALTRVCLDSYEPEVARYGGPEGVILAERLFHADSMAVLDILREMRKEAPDVERWQALLIGAHRLLEDLGFEDAQALALLADSRRRLVSAVPETPMLRKAIALRYRRNRDRIKQLIALAGGARESGIGAALERRSERLRALVPELKECRFEADVTAIDIAKAALHLFVNRLARFDPLAEELAAVDGLTRLYSERVSRGRDPAAAAFLRAERDSFLRMPVGGTGRR